MEDFEPVIGLEVHAQLSTESKIFASSSTSAGNLPNSQTDPTTLGLPGALPVLNKRVVEFAVRLGLATKCQIRRESIFARKHYFYPDLPKGYQISQYDKPICEHGEVPVLVNDERKVVQLIRIHLEEDAGKNIHIEHENSSIVDLNRAGVPLVEIVSAPDIRSAAEAGAYMRHIRQIVRYLDICDGNMEEGSLRCDANVSVRRKGETKFGTKVEIKNLNSFRFVEKAIEFEIARQIELLKQGEKIVQETRLWDEAKGITKTMRTKESAEDYRYFPDPDLLPLIIEEDWIEKVKAGLPELPIEAFQRFQVMFGLDSYLAELLTEEKAIAQYFDAAVSAHHNPKTVANWITSELFGRLNKEGLSMDKCPVSPENLAALVKLIDDGVISGKMAKTVFDEMFLESSSPHSIVESRGLRQVSDAGQLISIVERVLDSSPNQISDYWNGKTKMFGYFVGQVMKETGGKANPALVNELLTKGLESRKPH